MQHIHVFFFMFIVCFVFSGTSISTVPESTYQIEPKSYSKRVIPHFHLLLTSLNKKIQNALRFIAMRTVQLRKLIFGEQVAHDTISPSNPESCFDDVEISQLELKGIHMMRGLIQNISLMEKVDLSPWLFSTTNIDLLRFLRGSHGDFDKAYSMIIDHAKWRLSPEGGDTVLNNGAVTYTTSNGMQVYNFSLSRLNFEFFWLGVDKYDCVTVVGRTYIHDGVNYDENPVLFTSFVVWMLETAMQKYDIGHSRQVCLIIDRAPVPNFHKIESFDLRVIPNLTRLMSHLVTTLAANYPEILSKCKIMPAAWFFGLCYGILSKFMETRHRDRIQIISAENTAREMAALFPPEALPPHLGGTATRYGPYVIVA